MLSILIFRFVLVELKSLVTGHRRMMVRERLADKVEVIMKDPYSKYKNIWSLML